MSLSKETGKNPYISIVINSRNDNYQGGGFKRMQMAVDNFIDQAKRFRLRAELILVDWNPPADKPLLKDALSLPDDLGPVVVRFIIVPSLIHKKYNSSAKINIIGTAAWNVGIRRAEGEFILPTNSDILFSDELIQFLSSEKLRRDRFYRAVRCEVSRDILKLASLKKQSDFFKDNIIFRANLENEPSPHGLSAHPVLMTFYGADFLLFAKDNWRLMHGYPEINNLGLAADQLVCYMAYLSGLSEEILKDPMRIYHIDHDSRWRALYENKSGLYRFVKNKFFDNLKPNSNLRALIKKIVKTKNEVSMFFMNFYFPFLEKYSSLGKLDFNVKYISWKYIKTLRDMLKGKRPYAYTNDSWGLPKENFEEFIFQS